MSKRKTRRGKKSQVLSKPLQLPTHDSSGTTTPQLSLKFQARLNTTTEAVDAVANPENAAVVPVVLEPRLTDVLLGRGNGVATWKGNVNFRQIVWDYRDEYRGAGRFEKSKIAAKVLQEIASQDPPGRFLEFVGQDMYCIINDERALEKTCQALREKKIKPPSQKRRQMNPSDTDRLVNVRKTLKCQREKNHDVLVNDDLIPSPDVNPIGCNPRPRPNWRTRKCKHIMIKSSNNTAAQRQLAKKSMHDNSIKSEMASTLQDETPLEIVHGHLDTIPSTQPIRVVSSSLKAIPTTNNNRKEAKGKALVSRKRSKWQTNKDPPRVKSPAFRRQIISPTEVFVSKDDEECNKSNASKCTSTKNARMQLNSRVSSFADGNTASTEFPNKKTTSSTRCRVMYTKDIDEEEFNWNGDDEYVDDEQYCVPGDDSLSTFNNCKATNEHRIPPFLAPMHKKVIENKSLRGGRIHQLDPVLAQSCDKVSEKIHLPVIPRNFPKKEPRKSLLRTSSTLTGEKNVDPVNSFMVAAQTNADKFCNENSSAKDSKEYCFIPVGQSISSSDHDNARFHYSTTNLLVTTEPTMLSSSGSKTESLKSDCTLVFNHGCISSDTQLSIHPRCSVASISSNTAIESTLTSFAKRNYQPPPASGDDNDVGKYREIEVVYPQHKKQNLENSLLVPAHLEVQAITADATAASTSLTTSTATAYSISPTTSNATRTNLMIRLTSVSPKTVLPMTSSASDDDVGCVEFPASYKDDHFDSYDNVYDDDQDISLMGDSLDDDALLADDIDQHDGGIFVDDCSKHDSKVAWDNSWKN